MKIVSTFFFALQIVHIERGLFVVVARGVSGRISYPSSFNGSFPPEKNEPHITTMIDDDDDASYNYNEREENYDSNKIININRQMMSSLSQLILIG